MRIDERQLRGVLRVGVIAAVLAAMALVETQSRSGVLWRLVTFTYQANVLAAGYYAWTLASPKADGRVGLRGAVVVYVIVAGVIWNLFLVDLSMGYTAANVLLHIVVPVLAVADWLLVGHSQSLVRWWQPWAWLSYPAAYLALALLVLNHGGRRPPYYFLDVGSIGMAGLLSNVAILGAGLVFLGYLLSGVGRVAGKRGSGPVTNGAVEVNH
ncbi:Pr6Pr family membrane protein [soil metagenome]